MSKHTPGRWSDDQISGPNPRIIGALRLIKSDGFVIAFLPMWLDDEHVEARANARLIAAAPDLLEALKRISEFRLQDFMGPCHMAMECVAVAKSAIAKAEGSA